MNVFKYLAYVIASIFIILGIAILSGLFMLTNLPTQFRIMVGIVLILYGTFRILMTYYKKNRSVDDEK